MRSKVEVGQEYASTRRRDVEAGRHQRRRVLRTTGKRTGRALLSSDEGDATWVTIHRGKLANYRRLEDEPPRNTSKSKRKRKRTARERFLAGELSHDEFLHRSYEGP